MNFILGSILYLLIFWMLLALVFSIRWKWQYKIETNGVLYRIRRRSAWFPWLYHTVNPYLLNYHGIRIPFRGIAILTLKEAEIVLIVARGKTKKYKRENKIPKEWIEVRREVDE